MPEQEKYKSFDDIKCLWMKCGAVEYKICDNKFECENCEFEKAMMSSLNRNLNINEELDGILNPGQHYLSFTHPHYHYNNGLVVKNFLDNNYYLGLEPFAAKFIDNNSTISYFNDGKQINKDDIILKINNSWGEVMLRSPISFTYVDKLDLKNILKNGKHWFAIIDADKKEIQNNAINEKAYFEKFMIIKNYLRETLTLSDKVGTTMYDGGTILKNWFSVLGKDNYNKLMQKLFT